MANLILSVDPQVMGNPKLDLMEKLLLSYITTWEQKNACCFAKDGFLAALFGVKEAEVSYALIKLETLGFIEQIHGTGGRLIRTKKTETIQASQEIQDIFDGI